MWFAVYLIENMKKNMELQREINRTEKLHVMGELAAAVAHEIRNPMTVVRGFMQLLHQEQIEEHKKRMYTELMIGELDRAEEIINDYLTFAKPEAKHREEIDAGVEVQNAVNVMSSYALLRNVETITGIDHGLFVYLEPSKFRQCLVNLIKNGIEAMPDGGGLQVYAYRRGDSIVVDIIDEGIGMSPEEVSRLGSPFYSTKEKGTGLGLMVCYRIIELFNGKIHVRSEQGKGTAFSILLPASLEKK
ncbi:ATP-binding protein [Aneurinibacillus tyrosinisolvens]|uniref:ATP-binding protein n=1 Tax=Aneurinibacillus tyrosinisolvens TaxID=1443435 RepID=UPI000ACA44ED|nr:ATP-binding protein [Aneurinibacillus tyrosinisolvens]